MLVLTRRSGEQIVIADEIVITVVSIEGNKVRLGIEAPKDIRVDRKEIHHRRADEELAGHQQRSGPAGLQHVSAK